MSTNYSQATAPSTLIQTVDASVREALADLLGNSASVATQVVSAPLDRSALASLKADVPEVLVLGETGAAGRNSINLTSLGAAAKEEIKALIFEGDQPVTLTGLAGFGGVISLSDGDSRVLASNNSKSMTVATGAGNDSVATGGGSDSISIGGGADTVSTGSGSDTVTFTGSVVGGRVNTGSGDDAVVIGASFAASGTAPVVIDGGSGRGDSVDLSALAIDAVSRRGSTVTITLDDGSKLEVRNVEEFIYKDSGGQIVEIVGGARGFADDFNG